MPPDPRLLISYARQLEILVTALLKMASAQVVETSVTVTSSSFQNCTHPDDHTGQITSTDTHGFTPFSINFYYYYLTI